MPKYYRFRATTPSRKPRRKDKERDREVDRATTEPEKTWLDLAIACTPAPSWYLRRTSWRETPPIAAFPRQLASGLRASLQFNNRPIFVLKIPCLTGNIHSEDVLRQIQ